MVYETKWKDNRTLGLLGNTGGAALHCGLWEMAVSLSTLSTHILWLRPTSPTHRPAMTWLSALFRVACYFQVMAYQFELKVWLPAAQRQQRLETTLGIVSEDPSFSQTETLIGHVSIKRISLLGASISLFDTGDSTSCAYGGVT